MSEQQYRSVDKFDRALGSVIKTPATHTKPSTVVVETPLLGAQTFIVQTYRQTDRDDEKSRSRDTIFLQYVDGELSYRLVIPPEVADTIARQRDALTAKNRKKAAKSRALADKAAGKVPAFLKVKNASA
jgi:hypothetical protein